MNNGWIDNELLMYDTCRTKSGKWSKEINKKVDKRDSFSPREVSLLIDSAFASAIP